MSHRKVKLNTPMSPALMSTVELTTPSKPQDIESGPRPEEAPFINHHNPQKEATKQNKTTTESINLLFGVCGIWGCYLYYGSLQEDVFNYESPVDGARFKQAWLLQVFEAVANVIVGYIGMQIMGPTPNLPLKPFAVSGATQVSSKAFTSLALAHGLSFPVATLAKSGKMAPVMLGSLILGGASYTVREYVNVLMIIGGTAIVSMGKKKSKASTPPSTALGVVFILLSLVMDGVTAGLQKKLKKQSEQSGNKPKSYDFMFWTNLFMLLTAVTISLLIGDLTSGLYYCSINPDIWNLVIRFSICSALGQSFIFFTIANFDPLVCSTVTTTRKISSVLLSIFLKGHQLSTGGWCGVLLAISGILAEIESKCRARLAAKSPGSAVAVGRGSSH
mmetsp:Transcript_24555/g.36788  ORF Transcript_24555/g.36788 Transcript_24555/m.36788 type:complete len:390 (-) Transcript_24555:96-1265(-)